MFQNISEFKIFQNISLVWASAGKIHGSRKIMSGAVVPSSSVRLNFPHDVSYDSHHFKEGRLRSCCPHQLGSARRSMGLLWKQKTEESHWVSAPPHSISVLGETSGISL